MNSATEEVRRVLERESSGAIVCDSPANLGVAGGNNRGRSVARGRYIGLIHDDTEIHEDWLSYLVETLEARPEAGAVGSLAFYPDGRAQGAGCFLWREGMICPVWGFGEVGSYDLTSTRPVDYCGTASILVRADTWDAIGGLEEQLYPAYYIDVDLCMAIRKHGQIVVCDPRSTLTHHSGSTSKTLLKTFFAGRNRAFFLEKWKAELCNHEPYVKDDPAALARARARTESYADMVSRNWRISDKIAAPRVLDTAKHDALHVRKERELLFACIDKIESDRAALEADYATLRMMSENETAKRVAKVLHLKGRCEKLKLRLDKAKEKLRSQKRPLKWHQRLARSITRLWRRP
jgi:O-antigen biosynthesis protein